MLKLHTLNPDDTSTIVEIKQGHYPDGTLMLHLSDTPIHMIEWNYENDAELFTLICIKKHYDQYGDNIVLVVPYLPHARMDRVKNASDVFTLKYFCEIINSLNFYKVVVADVHSNVSLALLDRVEQASTSKIIHHALKAVAFKMTGEVGHKYFMEACTKLALFFPDEGAMKRYSDCANLPYAFGVKKRDWETGQIMELQIINSENVKGKDVLIIDDICSRGGTFLHSAKALKKAGAKNIYLYITHAENTMVEGEMYNDPNLIKHIFTSGSIFNKELDVLDKVSII